MKTLLTVPWLVFLGVVCLVTWPFGVVHELAKRQLS